MKRGENKKKQKQKKSWKFKLSLVLILVALLALAVVIGVKGFTVKKVIVKGNEHYPDEKIEEILLKDDYAWNSLYVYFKHKFAEPERIPFVDTMEVSLKSPHTLQVQVYEKGLLGCVYMEALGQNAYFDKDGFVVEMSSEVIENVPTVSGLEVEEIVIYEKLPIKGKSVLKNLLSLTQTLKKHNLVPQSIHYGGDGSYTLSYGTVTVLMGQAQNFSEKAVRLAYILPKLEGLSGTLHLEGWTEDTTDITFEKAQ